jgi:hypothetical protein
MARTRAVDSSRFQRRKSITKGTGINRSDCYAPPFWAVTLVTLRIEKGRVGFIEPMLAMAVTKLPEGAAWSYELKFDGYRFIVRKSCLVNVRADSPLVVTLRCSCHGACHNSRRGYASAIIILFSYLLSTVKQLL